MTPDQLPFDSQTKVYARRTDPVTSHEAAARVREFAPSQCDRVLEVLDKMPAGCGAEQLGYWLDMQPYAIRKRLADLQRLGVAEPTGRFRKTLSGRRERIWRAT